MSLHRQVSAACCQRQRCVLMLSAVADEMTKFKAAHPELRVEMPERMAYDGFAQLLRRTKLFVSPWG